MINVDFEWFDPNPEVDFHGIKTLLRQLFDVDNKLFDLSALADLILAQPQLGSTIKCDGKESDPYAFLTVLNLRQHRDVPAVKTLTDYLITKASSRSGGSLAKLGELLGPNSDAQVGLVLSERFINMPHQIVPPLYNMIRAEIADGVKQNLQCKFTHYLVLSKTYTEVESKLDAEDNPPSKKSKSASAEVFYFHPEDEALHKHAFDFHTYDYTKQGGEGESDSKRTFQELGIRPRGHLIALDAIGFAGAVKAVNEYLGADA